MLEESFIRIQKTVPVLTEFHDEKLPFWILLHGYAQNIKDFAKPFSESYSGKLNMIFPQAPSHFYQKGVNGELAASWMTKHYRKGDIQDQVDYLSELIQKYVPTGKKISFFGFSQGAPVAARMAEFLPQKTERMVLWSGNTDPKSIDQLKFVGRKIPIEHIHGNKDKFVENSRWEEYFDLLEKHDIEFTRTEYSGGHFFDSTLIKKYLKL